MKRKVLAAVAVAAMAVTALAGCGSSSSSGGAAAAGAAKATCTNKIVKADAPQVTVWAWYPSFAEVVDLFNASHTDVQICWTNAGQGNDEYTKFSTAIEAGRGAPDVVMLESEVLTSFAIRKALVDLTAYGANDVKADYTAGAWRDVSSGSAVYAIPVDGGPMGMIYRKDVFDAYGITVPKTWDEFAVAAAKLQAGGYKGKLVDFPRNGRAFIQALFAQKGAAPYTYDLQKPTDVTIGLKDAGSKQVLAYWQKLAQQKVVATDEAFTTDYNTKLVNGSYAVYLAAAWGPGYLKGLAGADPKAKWLAAPLPQWDAAHPVQVNWGGSAFAVTSQAKDKALSAKVAKEIFGTQEAWKIGIEKGALFPLWKPVLDSDYYKNLSYPFFGGQQINKDVFLDAASKYQGFTFSPFQNFAYDKLTEQVSAVSTGKKTSDAALDDLHAQVVKYAKEQGFTVTEK